MKILYIGNNPEAEYYEVTMLQEAGHSVFSLGEQLLPADLPESRKIPEYAPKEDLVELFWELHPNYAPNRLIKFHSDFLKIFDLFIMSDYPEHLVLNFKSILLHNKKIIWIWRKRPKATPQHYLAVLNLKGKGVRSVELPTGGRYKVDESKIIILDEISRL